MQKLGNCSELGQLPTVSILFGSHYFELSPVDYVLDLQAHSLGCIVMFTRDTGSNMILGVPFMKGFYIVHDLNNLSVGIVPQNTSSKSKGTYSLPPTQEPLLTAATEVIEEEESGPNLLWLWILLGVVGAAIIAVSLYFIIRWYKRKTMPELPDVI